MDNDTCPDLKEDPEEIQYSIKQRTFQQIFIEEIQENFNEEEPEKLSYSIPKEVFEKEYPEKPFLPKEYIFNREVEENIEIQTLEIPSNTVATNKEIFFDTSRNPDKDEKILLEIAMISREWDYLSYLERLTAYMLGVFYEKDPEKLDKLKISFESHPLYEKECFELNQKQFLALQELNGVEE
jgi:hypothetical protein